MVNPEPDPGAGLQRPCSEFELIRRYFTRPVTSTLLGVGDDAALVSPTPGFALAISCDVLVSGRHFLPDADPEGVGHKSAAVNLSDMAAMGARPRWVLLGLSMPSVDETWLASFSNGFDGLLRSHGVDWVGGDTTAGPLMVSVTIVGEVPAEQALRRSGARPGDDVWVSGTLGDAALGLRVARGTVAVEPEYADYLRARLERPSPRVALGMALREWAHAAIDVSDGLLGDLGHLLEASGCGAEIQLAQLPRSAALRAWRDVDGGRNAVLAGGDDYELCFTAPPQQAQNIQALGRHLGVGVTCIGRIVSDPAERCLRDECGDRIEIAWHGFDHFGRHGH